MARSETDAAQPPRAVITIPRRGITVTLSIATALLVMASVVVAVAAHEFDRPTLLGIVGLFDMDREGNVPSWFSGALLLACAVSMGIVWANASAHGEADARAWGALALFVGAASLDEVAAVHEAIGVAMGGYDDRFVYLVPGTLLLLIVVVLAFGFVRRLPSRVRNLLGLGAGVWALGAVVLELVQAASHNVGGLTGALLATAQDALELAGVIIVLHAVIHYHYVRAYVTTLSVR